MSSCDNCAQPIRITAETRSLCEPCTTLSERTNPIRISPLKSSDLELVAAWRSNPKIYRHFRKQEKPLDWEDHVSWFVCRDEDRHDFMIHYRGRRVGVVSITASDEVSIYLGDLSARGQGVATATLSWLCNRFEDRNPLRAEIHEENTKSIRLFEGCGFSQRNKSGNWLQYEYAADR